METKTAYRYTEDTNREYCGILTCYESPLEPGVFPVPANSTLTEPPETKTGYAVCYNGESWGYVEDHRGVTVWKDWQTSMVIKELGAIPEGWSEVQPEKPVTADDYDQAMENHLYETRAARGWTSREPDTIKSSNPRYVQDGLDFAAFRDAVYEYALKIENAYAAGESVPSITDFLAGMPKMKWTIEE